MASDTSVQPVGLFIALPLGIWKPARRRCCCCSGSGSSAALAPENVAEQLRWGAGWLEALPWAQRCKDGSTDIARAASFSRLPRRNRGAAPTARDDDRRR